MYARGKIGRNETIPFPTLEPTTISFEEAMAKIALEVLRRKAEERGKKKIDKIKIKIKKKKRGKEKVIFINLFNVKILF